MALGQAWFIDRVAIIFTKINCQKGDFAGADFCNVRVYVDRLGGFANVGKGKYGEKYEQQN
jgi:hypothetical protein